MFKKGTQAAKNYMAKLRAAKGKSKPKKLGALPVGFIGKMWGVQFKVQNQFDIYNNVQCICENKITGEQFCIINGIKKDIINQVAKFYNHILQNTDVSISDSDTKILSVLKKDISKFITNLSNEVDKYNKGQKVTSPVKNINIPKPTTLKKTKVSANKKVNIDNIKGKPIKKKGNTIQQWEFAGIHNKNKGKLLGVPIDIRADITNLYLRNVNEQKKLDNNLLKLKNLLKDSAYKSQKEQIKKQVILFTSLIKENKTHLKELKKLI